MGRGRMAARVIRRTDQSQASFEIRNAGSVRDRTGCVGQKDRETVVSLDKWKWQFPAQPVVDGQLLADLPGIGSIETGIVIPVGIRTGCHHIPTRAESLHEGSKSHAGA